MLARSIGWLLGLERVASVDNVRPALGAEWATHSSGPFWLCSSILVIVVFVFLFYLKCQGRSSQRIRLLLAASRSLLMVLLLITLAEPVLRISVTRLEPPRLFLVLDGTASMTLRDQYEPAQRTALAQATGLRDEQSPEPPPTRQDFVKSWLTRSTTPNNSPGGLLTRINQPANCQVHVFTFEGQTDSRLRELTDIHAIDGRIDWRQVATQLRSNGQVTAVGTVLRDLSRQGGRRRLSGIVLVSDFVQNSGEHPLSGSDPTLASPLKELGVPIYAVGIGAPMSRDVAVQLQPETKIRRGEKTLVAVRLHQTELAGEIVHVRLLAEPRGAGVTAPKTTEIASRDVTLGGDSQLLEIPFLPADAGEMDLRAEVSIAAGEVVTENNRATRRIQVIDDFIRLQYVAFEPTWEWRFVKEVFHRDPAVGLRGFRTYLASSDPRVRQSNPLFLPTLTQRPKDFFATDVVFLDDVPQATLTPQFCIMLEKFVRDLGGGLVVLAGPRFGPQQLANTPLAKMLPVIIDPNARLQDRSEFAIELSPRAGEFPFMQLDDDPELNRKAWDNLSHLPWYQPVANKHERAIVLAQHPTDKCLDGKTRQPIIAIRRYGAGEVVYLGFNETWRLRRMYGEKYYRRFWLPLIDRLGLSHALGTRKRFVVRTDRRQYRVDDEAIVSVQAYDENYQPLDASQLEGESLDGELVRVNDSGQVVQIHSMRIGALRPGVFESQFPVPGEGTYRIRVVDPVTKKLSQQQFSVTGASAEMRVSVRNDDLARELARQSGGIPCSFDEIDSLRDQIDLSPIQVAEEHNYAIWKTSVWFIAVISLMLGEWLLRKWIHLV